MSLRRSLSSLIFLIPTLLFAQTWGEQNPNQILNQLYDVSIDASGVGWTCGTGGLMYKSSDFGQNWTKLAQAPSGSHFYIAAIPATNGQGVVAAGTELISSQDGGQSWNTFVPTVQTGSYNGLAAPSSAAL